MNIYEQAIEKFGTDHQILKAVEELNELAVALMHYRQGKAGAIDVASEIADVQIMIGQMSFIIDPTHLLIDAALNAKLERLNKRIHENK